jgi:hypothetical protein
VKPMKNSPALRCGSAQSVANAACCCRDVHPGRCRLRLAHDEEDCREIQSKIFRPSLVPGGRLTATLVPHPGCLEELFSVPKSGWFEALNSAFSLLAQPSWRPKAFFFRLNRLNHHGSFARLPRGPNTHAPVSFGSQSISGSVTPGKVQPFVKSLRISVTFSVLNSSTKPVRE